MPRSGDNLDIVFVESLFFVHALWEYVRKVLRAEISYIIFICGISAVYFFGALIFFSVYVFC